MKEVHIEIMKEKIRKAWGESLEKGADAVIEEMGTHWHSLLAQAKARCDLKQKLMEIEKAACEEACKDKGTCST